MDTIIVIRLGRLGDVALTSPTIKNIRFLYPESKIIYITREMYKPYVRTLFGVDEVLSFPDEGSYLDLVKLSSSLYDYHPNLVIDLHKNFRSFHLANICKAKYKVVYKKRRKERQAAVNDKTFVNTVPHTIDLYNSVIDKLKGERITKRPDIFLPYTSLSNPGFRREGVAIAPGAGSDVKCWPAERFTELAEKIISDFNTSVSVFLSPRETKLEKHFAQLSNSNLNIYNNLSVVEIAEKLSQARLSITNDSGLMHVSSAVGTPTIALFGPTHEQLGFYPRGIHDLILGVDEKCRPCSLHGNEPCYREEQYCFTRMSVDYVFRYVANIFNDLELQPAVFIDRDGTLIIDRNYLADPDKIEFIPGSIEAVRKFRNAGYKIIVVSNQSGVARGFFSEEIVEKVNNRLRNMLEEEGAPIDDIVFCPYHPDGDVPEYTKDKECRKPKPGMVEESAIRHGIDIKRSFMIGDKLSDIQCGQAAGAIPILVRTGKGEETEKDYPSPPYPQPYFICDDLAEAGNSIISQDDN